MKNYLISQTSYYLNRIRNAMIASHFEHLDLSCVLSRKADILGSSNISIGAKTVIHDFARIQCTGWNKSERELGKISIGENCSIQPYTYLHSVGGKMTIGNNCSVNPFTLLYGAGGLTIGNNVRIATHVVIIPSNHNFNDSNIPIHFQGVTRLGIQIEDDVWIGAGVIILDGVHIGKGCVIGAGSIVTHSTDDYGIYVGNPARLIKSRRLE